MYRVSNLPTSLAEMSRRRHYSFSRAHIVGTSQNLVVLELEEEIGGVPVSFSIRTNPVGWVHASVVAVNGGPSDAEVAEGCEGAPSNVEINAALEGLRPHVLSAGGGHAFYCTREASASGSERLLMDPTGSWIAYEINTVEGAAGGLLVRGGEPVGIHVGVGGLKEGKVWEGSFGLALAVDAPEIRPNFWLSTCKYMVDS